MTPGTEGEDYTARLERLGGARWKRLVDVQRPYRWNLRRLHLGATLDVGCGIGRNLAALDAGSLGVDHNATSVAIARGRGLDACTDVEFERRRLAERSFDSMLVAHVLEHMAPEKAFALVTSYLPYVRHRVVAICPQERGYRSDSTHVTYLDAEALEQLLRRAGLEVVRSFSFPLPRPFGKLFTHNETVVIAQR